MPELLIMLVKEDMEVDDRHARPILEESQEVGVGQWRLSPLIARLIGAWLAKREFCMVFLVIIRGRTCVMKVVSYIPFWRKYTADVADAAPASWSRSQIAIRVTRT